MAWATNFVTALGASEVWMRFALVRAALWDEYTPSPDPFAVTSNPDDPVLLAAFPGMTTTVSIDVGEGSTLAITDQTLDMRACRGGGSGLTVALIGEPGSLRATMVQIPVGAAVELVALASTDQGGTWEQEVVYRGRVRSMRRVGPRMEVDITGIEVLAGRPNATLSRTGRILASTGGTSSLTLSSAYTVGDSHVHVSAAPPWTPTAPAKGVIIVEHGTEFAVTYTGVATGPNRATGLPSVSTVSSSASALSGADVIDSGGRPIATYKERVAADPPLANAPSGTVVRFPAYYNGHPIEAIRRLLTSRGSLGPANGTYDVLPWEWGLGIDEGVLDTTEMSSEVAGTSGALLERVEELRDQSEGVDPAALVEEMAAQAGFFVAQRQGRLTVRAIPNPYGSGIVSVSVTDDDLAWAVGADALAVGEGLPVEHDPWPSLFPVFRQLLYVSNALGYHVRTYAFTGSIPTTVCEGRAALVLTDRWGPHGASDTAVVEAGDRLAASQMAVPEIYAVTLRSLKWARLTKGDFVTLTLDAEISRQGTGLVDGLLGVVLSVSVDWLMGTVRLEVACFSPSHDPENPDIIVVGNTYTGGN